MDSQVYGIVADAVRTDFSKARFVTNEDKSGEYLARGLIGWVSFKIALV